MTNQDKIEALGEALEHLAEAEQLVRSLKDPHLDAYVADHIDVEGRCLGTSIAGEIQAAIGELETECIELDSEADPTGTGHFGDTIDEVSRHELEMAFGPAHYMGYDAEGHAKGDGKVRYEWKFTMPNGTTGTLYDYKEPEHAATDKISWHIGAKGKTSSRQLAAWIEDNLK